MQLIGYIFFALAAIVWMIGGQAVIAQHRRRTGTTENFPFRAAPLPRRSFNRAERRRLLYCYLGALLLGFIGSTFANGVFEP